jgi:hypothetical protein
MIAALQRGVKPPPDAALTVVDIRENLTGKEYLVEWYAFGVRCECWVGEDALETADDPA